MNRTPAFTPSRAAVIALAFALGGCSSDGLFGDSKVDYHSESAKIAPLDIPPDLTQLQPSGGEAGKGPVSASTFTPQNQQASAAPGVAPDSVAPNKVGDARIVRDDGMRRIVTAEAPEQLWPKVEAFWKSQGFNISVDQPKAGLIETDWAENRAKLPQDFLRRTIGKVIDGLYDTGTRDKYRTRIERTDRGTEITITQQGMEEVVTGAQKDQTIWQPRQPDPELEAIMLQRLMLALGGQEEAAAGPAAAASAAASTPAAAMSSAPGAAATADTQAHLLSDQAAAALQLDETFDHAWRRVGLALDRGGFTVEDRDRAKGLYYVRYVDPKYAGQEEPNFFQKLFGHKDDERLSRYRIEVKAEAAGAKTLVSVLNAQGAPDNGEQARRIIKLLYEDLK